MLSPLDQLYLETTSKEDLLAEINDQRRQVIEARGIASELQRKLWAVEKERDELLAVEIERDELKGKNRKLTALLSNYRRRYNITPRTHVRSDIISLMEDGLSNKEIIENGFNKNTVESVRAMIKKSANQN